MYVLEQVICVSAFPHLGEPADGDRDLTAAASGV
jgi:hypothetical protein